MAKMALQDHTLLQKQKILPLEKVWYVRFNLSHQRSRRETFPCFWDLVFARKISFYTVDQVKVCLSTFSLKQSRVEKNQLTYFFQASLETF